MQLTDQKLTEFQSLWRKNFGAEITKEQALEKGLRLVRLVEITGRAIVTKQQDTRVFTENHNWIP